MHHHQRFLFDTINQFDYPKDFEQFPTKMLLSVQIGDFGGGQHECRLAGTGGTRLDSASEHLRWIIRQKALSNTQCLGQVASVVTDQDG